jgi:hypothetical protein
VGVLGGVDLAEALFQRGGLAVAAGLVAGPGLGQVTARLFARLIQ